MKRNGLLFLFAAIILLVDLPSVQAIDREVTYGGRINLDYMFPDADRTLESAVGEISEGSEFRRARIFITGTLYDRIEFKAEYDFAGGDADFKDVYMGITKIPTIGGIRIGHFKEPFSLEEMTGANYITFMERALPVGAFAPSRNNGFMIHSAETLEGKLTWAAGIFKESDDFGEADGNSRWSVTARVTGLPWYEDEGRKCLHLGGSYSFRNPDDNTVRYRTRPEVQLSPAFVDTGSILDVDSVGQGGAEAALVYSALSLQGEFIYADVDRKTGENPAFSGYYVSGSYFLTGEHRPIRGGKFARVKPGKPFLVEGGPGAWEVGVRYSFVDLSDGGITGGELSDITVGLSWYLNARTRVMLNYVYADLDDVGEANFVTARFQIDF